MASRFIRHEPAHTPHWTYWCQQNGSKVWFNSQTSDRLHEQDAYLTGWQMHDGCWINASRGIGFQISRRETLCHAAVNASIKSIDDATSAMEKIRKQFAGEGATSPPPAPAPHLGATPWVLREAGAGGDVKSDSEGSEELPSFIEVFHYQ